MWGGGPLFSDGGKIAFVCILYFLRSTGYDVEGLNTEVGAKNRGGSAPLLPSL